MNSTSVKTLLKSCVAFCAGYGPRISLDHAWWVFAIQGSFGALIKAVSYPRRKG